MRAGGGHSKGASFERDSCKLLSKWMTRGRRDDLFWRTAMSGGRATVQFKKGKKNRTQTGDICAISPEGERLTSIFLIENKFYADLKITDLMLTGRHKSGLPMFWSKLVKDSQTYGRMPMLIAKQNFLPEVLVCLDAMGLKKLRMGAHVRAEFPRRGLFICYFRDLLKFGFAP